MPIREGMAFLDAKQAPRYDPASPQWARHALERHFTIASSRADVRGLRRLLKTAQRGMSVGKAKLWAERLERHIEKVRKLKVSERRGRR
jgi:hypothetical protein